MAGGTTPPHGATRFVETTRGILSYSQLAPSLAERALVVERAIASGEFASQPISADLICSLHQQLCGDLIPEWSGRWRAGDVRVGDHTPPPAFRVAELMADYSADLTARLSDARSVRTPHLLIEHLAFAEGRLLSIHPFQDFNGRVTRLWLRELIQRLELPAVPLVPPSPEDTFEYLTALRSADALNWHPLTQIWTKRFQTVRGDDTST
ncbi:MAG: Fic family protein [Verrucomicrobiales bacterium]|nr:Fic family protein [Verrucomicrobiales bacterium]